MGDAGTDRGRMETLAALKTLAQQTIVDNPDIDAIVLFGSQARGDATGWSDYDVAVVSEQGRCGLGGHEIIDNIDVLPLRTDRVRQPWRASIEHSVRAEGRLLAGDPSLLTGDTMKPLEPGWLERKVELVCDAAETAWAMAALADDHRLTDKRQVRKEETAVRVSADAAEFVTDVVVAVYGLRPRRGHGLENDAESLETLGPRQPSGALNPHGATTMARHAAERVLAMNGDNRAGHNVLYTGYVPATMHRGRWAERIVKALELLCDVLEGVLHASHKGWNEVADRSEGGEYRKEATDALARLGEAVEEMRRTWPADGPGGDMKAKARRWAQAWGSHWMALEEPVDYGPPSLEWRERLRDVHTRVERIGQDASAGRVERRSRSSP